MSSSEFSVVAIIHPKKGKADRIITLLQDVSKYVQDNEPGTLQYEIHRDLRPGKDGNEDIVMIEKYKDQAALKTHGTSKPFAAFQQQLKDEDLIRAPMDLKMIASKGGFTSKL